MKKLALCLSVVAALMGPAAGVAHADGEPNIDEDVSVQNGSCTLTVIRITLQGDELKELTLVEYKCT